MSPPPHGSYGPNYPFKDHDKSGDKPQQGSSSNDNQGQVKKNKGKEKAHKQQNKKSQQQDDDGEESAGPSKEKDEKSWNDSKKQTNNKKEKQQAKKDKGKGKQRKEESKPEPKPEPEPEPEEPEEDLSAAPVKLVKPYWADWEKPVDKNGRRSARNISEELMGFKKRESKSKPPGSKPIETPVGHPTYMDSMKDPYAVFVFKYRSRGLHLIHLHFRWSHPNPTPPIDMLDKIMKALENYSWKQRKLETPIEEVVDELRRTKVPLSIPDANLSATLTIIRKKPGTTQKAVSRPTRPRRARMTTMSRLTQRQTRLVSLQDPIQTSLKDQSY